MITLVLPQTQYQNTYLEALEEFQQENNPRASNYLELDAKQLANNFSAYVQQLLNHREGRDLPEGWIPATEYWIIDDQDQYIGRVHIRPSKRSKG